MLVQSACNLVQSGIRTIMGNKLLFVHGTISTIGIVSGIHDLVSRLATGSMGLFRQNFFSSENLLSSENYKETAKIIIVVAAMINAVCIVKNIFDYNKVLNEYSENRPLKSNQITLFFVDGKQFTCQHSGSHLLKMVKKCEKVAPVVYKPISNFDEIGGIIGNFKSRGKEIKNVVIKVHNSPLRQQLHLEPSFIKFIDGKPFIFKNKLADPHPFTGFDNLDKRTALVLASCSTFKHDGSGIAVKISEYLPDMKVTCVDETFVDNELCVSEKKGNVEFGIHQPIGNHYGQIAAVGVLYYLTLAILSPTSAVTNAVAMCQSLLIADYARHSLPKFLTRDRTIVLKNGEIQPKA